MPVCKKCSKPFPNFLKISGKVRNLCHRKYCIECSPFDKHNTLKLHEDRIEKNGNIYIRHCVICQKPIKNKRVHGRKCGSCLSNLRRFDRKIRAVEYKGGHCVKCGYDRPIYRNYVFHHEDPTTKDFAIGGAHCRRWEVLQKELDKCTLYCQNCHGEVHDEIDKKTVVWKLALRGGSDESH